MEAKLVSIKDFMMSSDSNFYIPIYQRSYAWTATNIQLLMDEVIEVFHNQGKKQIFLGNIILANTTGTNDFEIVDGQQRTVTVFLMTLAARNILIKEGSAFSGWAANMIDLFLSNSTKDPKTGEKTSKIKLTANNKDEKSLNTLFNNQGKVDTTVKDNVNNNYNLMYKILSDVYKEYNDPSKFFDAFFDVLTNGIRIVRISIANTDPISPQDVFESINSTGVPLTNLDLIRNYALMGNDQTEQKEFWSKTWEPFEEDVDKHFGTNMKEFDSFLQKYVEKVENKKVAIGDIYKDFKEFADKTNSKQEVITNLHDALDEYKK